MTINAPSRNVRITLRGYDGAIDSSNAAGTPGGGTAALGWNAPSGLTAGNSLIISTDGTYDFGATGPTVAVYDDFRTGTPGDSIPNGAATINGWSANGYYTNAEYKAGGRDGNACMRCWNSALSLTARILGKQILFADTSEVFLFWSMKMGGGYGGTATPGVWDSSSHMKTIWLNNNAAIGTGDGNDIALFSHAGTGSVIIGGNDSQDTKYLGAAKDIGNYDFDGWNVYQCWIKGGASPTTDLATMWASFTNANRNAGAGQQTMTDANPFSASDGIIDRAMVPGWFGNLDDAAHFDPLLDDAYVATGTGAAARVVLGNASTYTGSTELWIAPPTAWSASQITCMIPSTASGVSGMFLYVFDSTNTLINSSGVAL